MSVTAKAVLDAARANPTQSCKGPEQCRVVSFHYVGGGVVDGVYVGAAYSQRYDVWLTVFSKGELPETFTALPSG